MPAKKNIVSKNTPELTTEVVKNTETINQDGGTVELNNTESKTQKKNIKQSKNKDVVLTDNKLLSSNDTPGENQIGGKKINNKKETESDKQQKRGRKKVEQKENLVKKSKKKVQEGGEEDDLSDHEKRIRSFKVRLPGKEEFEGRFTGLTPYQAANKALSKYFRENKSLEGDTDVSFSIIESTRKSDKHIYTYIGKRYKLEVPVVYKIKDANGESREIVKNFKNVLKKVKKSDQ